MLLEKNRPLSGLGNPSFIDIFYRLSYCILYYAILYNSFKTLVGISFN